MTGPKITFASLCLSLLLLSSLPVLAGSINTILPLRNTVALATHGPCYDSSSGAKITDTGCNTPSEEPAGTGKGIDLGGILSAIANLPGTIAGKILDLITSVVNINNIFSTVATWANCTLGGINSSPDCAPLKTRTQLNPGTTNTNQSALPAPQQTLTNPDYVASYGAIGFLTASLDQTINSRPFKSVDYLASIHLIPSAQATGFEQIQGNRGVVGNFVNLFTQFSVLGTHPIADKPILAVWLVVRNIAYSAFVLVMMAVGLMIMFRSKLDPRTVITVSNSLPRLVLALILVTFSFPIAGLFVDLANVLVELVKATFGPLISGAGLDLGLVGWLNFAILVPFQNSSCPETGGAIGNLISCVGGVAANAINPATLIVNLFLFLFRIAVVIILVILNFTLLMRFINIIFLAIFSPFFFLIGALPSGGGTITSWFRNMLANSLAFPGVLAVLYIAALLKFTAGLTPPAPVTGFISAPDIGSFLTFGALVLATRVPAMLENAFDAIAPSHVAKSGFGIQQLPLVGGMFGRR